MQEALFDGKATTRPITLIVEAKQMPNSTETANVLTKEAFQEMLDFEELMFDVWIYDDAFWDQKGTGKPIEPGGNGKVIRLADICQEYN